VTVNLNTPGGGTTTATVDPSDLSTGSPAQGGATQEGVDPANPADPGGDPGAGDDPVEMIMGALKKIDMRVSALEQAAGGGQAPQPAKAPPKPPAAGEGGGGGFPPKKPTQDIRSARAKTKDDDPAGTTPSGAPGPELEKDMSVKGGEGGDGGGGPSPENKDAPLLKTEEGSDGDHSGQDPLPKKTTGDSMYVPTPMEATRRREEWTDTLARAEMLMPGVRLPTFDAAFDEKQTSDTLCTFKRKTLAASFETARGEGAIRDFITTDAPNFTSMTCDAVNVLFRAASQRMRNDNNILSVHRGPAIMPPAAGNGTPPRTPAEVNAFNRAFWEAKERGV
jgi:hypothetical protein